MTTIKDIARKAGVSVSTASRAMNNNKRISNATRERIHKIAAELNYVPNASARNLTRGEANMVALVLPVTSEDAPADPFHLDLMRGISKALTPRHYTIALAIAAQLDQLLEQVKSLAEQGKVKNFLVFYAIEDDPVTAYLRDAGLNYVVIGHPNHEDQDRFVDSDNVAAGRAATERILKLGIHHPLFVHSEHNFAFEQRREKGYRQVMLEHDLEPQSFASLDDETAVKRAMTEMPLVDGLITADDVLLLRFASQAQRQGCYRQMPVICFNNSRLIGMVLSNVIKVDLLPRQMGAQAVDLLFDRQKKQSLVDFRIVG
ncbi:LacI family DNA-binding transcriptional regulator [Limosilactobacillus difficilis]|uniref:LacI family DNA-binding transcriptional regulator n=1 Tax=Limosilactobacillus difficilis TaxID=2991838 RepID=UPI0024BB2C88|nr:LacI family DNA-binding transcriptional regulator [Limosilactobacillus difficilis]